MLIFTVTSSPIDPVLAPDLSKSTCVSYAQPPTCCWFGVRLIIIADVVVLATCLSLRRHLGGVLQFRFLLVRTDQRTTNVGTPAPAFQPRRT